jgi:hypothetical protein
LQQADGETEKVQDLMPPYEYDLPVVVSIALGACVATGEIDDLLPAASAYAAPLPARAQKGLSFDDMDKHTKGQKVQKHF